MGKKYILIVNDKAIHMFDCVANDDGELIKISIRKKASECSGIYYGDCNQLNKESFLSIADECLNRLKGDHLFEPSSNNYKPIFTLAELRIFAAHFENWYSSNFSFCGGCIRTLYSS